MRIIRVGIFADKPFACTGFAIVCSNLARYLAQKINLQIYYFGRFGFDELNYKPKDGFLPSPVTTFQENYLYVPCESGVWKRETVVRIIKHYKLDIVFTEDDWFSAFDICLASAFWGKPFHFLTPIDSLPIHIMANKLFKDCHTIYTPNSSWKIIKEKGFNAKYLPHGVNTRIFKPIGKKIDKFTFLLIGRDDSRKAIGRGILAFEKVIKKGIDAAMVIHSDWSTPNAKRTSRYIKLKGLPILLSQMSNMPHRNMVHVYNLGHVNLCTSKAGGFEMGTIEAAACQVPSLVTDWTYMREAVVDGKTGFLIGRDGLVTERKYQRVWANISINDLTRKMLWCYKHQDKVKEMGLQAREYVKKTFSWAKAGKTLYESLTKSVSEKNVKKKKKKRL